MTVKSKEFSHRAGAIYLMSLSLQIHRDLRILALTPKDKVFFLIFP